MSQQQNNNRVQFATTNLRNNYQALMHLYFPHVFATEKQGHNFHADATAQLFTC